MKNWAKRSLKVKGTVVAVLLVSLACFLALAVASGVFVLMVTQGVFSEHSFEGMLVFILITLVGCVGLCSIFLPKALSRITEPLSELSVASKKVAAGNFDVDIKYDRDDELGILSKNFNTMAEELSKMEYLRKDFVSSVSHEFKTPLSAIQGFSELLCDESIAQEERLEYQRILSEETTRLTKLCNNMLRMSRLDNDAEILHPKQYLLDEQIRRSIVLLEELWRQKDIGFKLDLAEVSYWGDEELLQQVWLNLIENAIKFAPEKSFISIECVRTDQAVRVSIRNAGNTLTDEQQKRIFERFYQGDASRNESGNGLGLSIVRRILDLSVGAVECESNEDEGTTFTVILTALNPSK